MKINECPLTTWLKRTNTAFNGHYYMRVTAESVLCAGGGTPGIGSSHISIFLGKDFELMPPDFCLVIGNG